MTATATEAPPAQASTPAEEPLPDPSWDYVPGQELPPEPIVLTIAGDFGLGKTHVAQTFPGPILLFDTEARARQVARKFKNTYIKVVKTFQQIQAGLGWGTRFFLPAKGKRPGTVVFDSGSDFRDILDAWVVENMKGDGMKVHPTLHWKYTYATLSELLAQLRSGGWNVVFTARLGEVYVDDRKTGKREVADFVRNKLYYHSDYVIELEKVADGVVGHVRKNGAKRPGTYREVLTPDMLEYSGIVRSMEEEYTKQALGGMEAIGGRSIGSGALPGQTTVHAPPAPAPVPIAAPVLPAAIPTPAPVAAPAPVQASPPAPAPIPAPVSPASVSPTSKPAAAPSPAAPPAPPVPAAPIAAAPKPVRDTIDSGVMETLRKTATEAGWTDLQLMKRAIEVAQKMSGVGIAGISGLTTPEALEVVNELDAIIATRTRAAKVASQGADLSKRIQEDIAAATKNKPAPAAMTGSLLPTPWTMSKEQASDLTGLAAAAKLTDEEKTSIPAAICGRTITDFSQVNEDEYNKILVRLRDIKNQRNPEPVKTPTAMENPPLAAAHGEPAKAAPGAMSVMDVAQEVFDELLGRAPTAAELDFFKTGNATNPLVPGGTPEQEEAAAGKIAWEWARTFRVEVETRRALVAAGENPLHAPTEAEKVATDVGRKCLARLAEAGYFRKPGGAFPDAIYEIECIFRALGADPNAGWARIIDRGYAKEARKVTEKQAKDIIAGLSVVLKQTQDAAKAGGK